jgi:hypothetical protein
MGRQTAAGESGAAAAVAAEFAEARTDRTGKHYTTNSYRRGRMNTIIPMGDIEVHTEQGAHRLD